MHTNQEMKEKQWIKPCGEITITKNGSNFSIIIEFDERMLSFIVIFRLTLNFIVCYLNVYVRVFFLLSLVIWLCPWEEEKKFNTPRTIINCRLNTNISLQWYTWSWAFVIESALRLNITLIYKDATIDSCRTQI